VIAAKKKIFLFFIIYFLSLIKNLFKKNKLFKQLLNNVGGGFCNFMHLKYISKDFKRSLFEQMFNEHPEYRDDRY